MFRLTAAAIVVVAVAATFGAADSEAGNYGWGSAQFWGKACLQTECGGPAIGQTVVAKVGNVECGQDVTQHPHSDGEEISGYAMNVLTANQKAGCAESGDVVQFFIGGEPALPTVTWEIGSHRVDINTGPRFANFHGTLICDGEPCIPFEVDFQIAPRVDAYIDGLLCGSHQMSGWLITSYYDVNVKSAEAQPGCGIDGATVTFTVDGVPANETAPWVAGPQTVPLSTGSATLVWGDIDCSGEVNPIDALHVLFADAGIAHPSVVTDCPWYDDSVQLEGQSEAILWSDIDCSGDASPLDSLKVLMFDAGEESPIALPCPAIGTTVYLVQA